MVKNIKGKEKMIMGRVEFDCRGLACPGPVITVKKYIEKKYPEKFRVIADNVAAKENVVRFLDKNYYDANIKEDEGDFIIEAFKREGGCNIMNEEEFIDKKTLVLIGSRFFGKGDDNLGKRLMINFINTLKESEDEIFTILFLNSGVKLAIKDSPVLEALKYLEKRDIKILVCGTCLNYFNLLDDKGVGETTNMLDIVSAIRVADKVIDIT